MDLCAFSYVMLRVKLRMYVSSLPYSTNLTYDREIYLIVTEVCSTIDFLV